MYVCYVVCARLVNNMWEILFLFCSTRKLFSASFTKVSRVEPQGGGFSPLPEIDTTAN